MNLVKYIKSHDEKTISKCKKLIIAGLLIGLTISGYEVYKCSTNIQSVEKPDSKKGNIEKKYNLYIDGSKEKVDLEIEAQKPSEKQNKAEVKRAIEEIDSTVFGNCKSADEVNEDLIIKDSYSNGNVDASFSFDRYDLIGSSGNLRWENIKEDTIVKACVSLTCNDYSEDYTFFFNIKMPDKNTREGFIYYLKERIKKEGQEKKKEISLPKEYLGKSLLWKESYEGIGIKIAALFLIMAIAILVGADEEKVKTKKNVQKEMDIDYPKIVGSLSLYVGAGVSIKNAFRRIANDYLKKEELRPGYELIVKMLHSMDDGKSEIASYEEMGKKSQNKNYKRLSLIITQNLRKGTSGLIAQLEKEEQEAFNIRKMNARIAGEEASTKLLFPMIGLLGIVLVILIVPAVLGMDF